MNAKDDRAEGNGVVLQQAPRNELPQRRDPAFPTRGLGRWGGLHVIPPAVRDDAAPVEWSRDFVDLEGHVMLVGDGEDLSSGRGAAVDPPVQEDVVERLDI